jgi:hypothetical protein
VIAGRPRLFSIEIPADAPGLERWGRLPPPEKSIRNFTFLRNRVTTDKGSALKETLFKDVS